MNMTSEDSSDFIEKKIKRNGHDAAEKLMYNAYVVIRTVWYPIGFSWVLCCKRASVRRRNMCIVLPLFRKK